LLGDFGVRGAPRKESQHFQFTIGQIILDAFGRFSPGAGLLEGANQLAGNFGASW
jgi:hypothetical protein